MNDKPDLNNSPYRNNSVRHTIYRNIHH